MRNEGGGDESHVSSEEEGAQAIIPDAGHPSPDSQIVKDANGDLTPIGQIEMPLWAKAEPPRVTALSNPDKTVSDALGVTVKDVEFNALPPIDLIIGGLGIEERCEAVSKAIVECRHFFKCAA